MLTPEQQEELTRVSHGTPMGELLRRYWWPVATSQDLHKYPVKGVRLLGDNFTLYKNRKGELGLVGQRCAHRNVDLSYGMPTDEGLQCPYHGWTYDRTGQCIAQPLESPETTFAQRVKIAGHHVQELAGLVWGYIGPEPAPLLPRWHPLVEEHAIRGIGTVMLDCNWLQVLENSVDTPHSTYTHGYFSRYIREVLGIKDDIGEARSQNTRRRRMLYAYDPFEYGIIKRNLHEGERENADNWGIGHPLLFPNITVISGLGWKNMQIRVPIDDEHTWIAYYYVYLLHPEVEAPAQDPVPAYEIPVPRFPTHYAGQDSLMWVAQGVITDRVHERLTELDKGIILFRKMLQEQIKIVQDGGEPMNTFRDPEKNQYIEFPLEAAGSESYGATEGYRAGTIISSTHTEQFSPAGKVVDELLTRSEEASRRHLSTKPS